MIISDLREIEGRQFPARRKTQPFAGAGTPIPTEEFSVGFVTFEPNGGQVPWHNQAQEEIYFVIEGEGEMCLGTERQTLKAGQAVYIPPGEYHQLTNTGDVPLKMIYCCAAGFVAHPQQEMTGTLPKAGIDVPPLPDGARSQHTDPPQTRTRTDQMPTSQTSSPHLGRLQPRGTRRLIYVSDPSNTTSHLGVPAAKPEELRQIVRNYASAGSIDTLVQEIFAEAMTMFWRTDKCPYDIRHQHQRLIPIMDTGVMPVEIYIDECHKQGMEFIAGFRMNDRHGHHTEFFKKLCDEKPEWVLREYKPSTRRASSESRKYGCSLNYAVPEVRAFLLAIMEEVANRFDIDGIEFNFTRLAECFPRAELSHSHSTMTGFIRQVRNMLDNARSPTGRDRNLILGVRVPQQMAGCKNLSLDVPTWIKEGLIDYVAPGDFGFTDFNEKYEDFVSIARQHNCYVYPQVQPRLSIDTEFLMDMPQYRAALQNFYAAGADGFSTQNYFFHWGPQFEPPGTNGAKIPAMYPSAMNDLKELKDPQSIGPDRHYTFRSLWANSKSLGEVYIKEELVLSRQKMGQRDTFRFRLCEHLSSEPIPSENTLTFFAQGLSKDDALTVDINGTKIPSQNLTWTWPDDDQPPSCTIALSNPPFIYGDNHLGLTISKSAENIDGDIIVDHIECGIRSLSQAGDQ